jgi:S1-C subfamily serine protease
VPQSSADRIGLRAGDVILRVDRAVIEDRQTFRRAVSKLRGRRQVLLLVQRGGRGYHVTLGIS